MVYALQSLKEQNHYNDTLTITCLDLKSVIVLIYRPLNKGHLLLKDFSNGIQLRGSTVCYNKKWLVHYREGTL